MTSKLYARRGGGEIVALTDITPITPYFDDHASLIELGVSCQNGAASQGRFTVIDPDSQLDNVPSGGYLPSHTLIRWTEDASGDEYWLAVGRISGAETGRGDVVAGDYIQHDQTVDDANVDLRGLAFTEDWVRPEETDTDRLYALYAYILNAGSSTSPTFRYSTDVVIAADHLAPDTNTVTMPAKTYPAGTQPQEVVDDCASSAGKGGFGVVIHHLAGSSHLCLFYTLSTDNTTYASPVKISDKVANWDPDDLTAPVFEPHWIQGKGLIANGQTSISGLVSRYGPNVDQFLYVNDPAQEVSTEIWIDSYADSDSVDAPQATGRAISIRDYRSAGDFTYRVSVVVRPEQTHLLTAGMSLEIDTAVILGNLYRGTYVAQRIVACSWEPREDGRYWAHLQLNRGVRNFPPSSGKAQPAATSPALGDPGFGVIETDNTWRVLNTIGVTAPTGWNQVGFDDSAWDLALGVEGGVYPAGLTMDSEVGVPVVPSDEILLRQEFIIEAADLIGADVALKYAADNGGRFYVNGVEIASLTPLFSGTPTSNFTSDHATTLARSTFQAGLNCVAIYATNDSAGTPGNIPPGALRAGIYIDIPTRNLSGTGDTAAREDHDHRHADILGRDAPEQHPAAAVTYDNATSGLTADDVQAAIDELADSSDIGQLLRQHMHGVYVAVGHERGVGDWGPRIMWSLDGKDFRSLTGEIATDNSPNAYAGDSAIMHWNGKWWITHQFSTAGITKFTIQSSDDLVTWAEVHEVDTGIGGIVETYPGAWARNEDGSVYVDPSDGRPRFVFTATTGSVGTGPYVPYEIHPTNDALTTWSTAAALTGDWPSSIIDPFWVKHGDEWALWYKRQAAEQVTYATSATLTGTYVQQETGDWAGWGTSREDPNLVKLDDGRWRIYLQKYTGSNNGIFWSESDDDWATWSSLVQVTTDFDDDYMLFGIDVLFIPGMYDHERDPGAHADVLSAAVPSFATPAIVLGTAAAAGAAATVIRSDSTIVAFDATVPVTQAYSDAAAAGSAAVAARRDHRHGMPASGSGIGEILISDTPSTPLIFADLIQNEAQDDLVYADP